MADIEVVMMARLKSGEGIDLSQMLSSQTEARNHMKTKDSTVDKEYKLAETFKEGFKQIKREIKWVRNYK